MSSKIILASWPSTLSFLERATVTRKLRRLIREATVVRKHSGGDRRPRLLKIHAGVLWPHATRGGVKTSRRGDFLIRKRRERIASHRNRLGRRGTVYDIAAPTSCRVSRISHRRSRGHTFFTGTFDYLHTFWSRKPWAERSDRSLRPIVSCAGASPHRGSCGRRLGRPVERRGTLVDPRASSS